MLRILILLIFSVNFFLAGQALAADNPFSLNGKIFSQGDVLAVERVDNSTETFSVRFSGYTYKSFLFEGKPKVFIGIDYRKKPKNYSLNASTRSEKITTIFLVKVLKKFPPKNYIAPIRPEEIQKEVNGQLAGLEMVFNKFSKNPLFASHFSAPLKELKVTKGGNFGEDRCGNRKISSRHCRYHTGTDFHAIRGEEIFAANAGRVAEAADYITMGKAIILDHGGGIFTGYLHLSKFSVKKGDLVKSGQVIGRAGKTGTDAVHLHFFVRMNNGRTTVDPEKFFEVLKSH